MKYKLIATDMDGTLLDDDKKVSERTLKAIEKAKAEGILFSICTGRNITGIKNYMELLKPTGPVICNNGALIKSSDGSKILYKKLMEPEDARAVYELGCELKTTLIIWSGDQFYTNELNDRSYGYEKYSNLKPVLMPDFDKLLEEGITKILFSDEPARIDEIVKLVESRRNMDLNRRQTGFYHAATDANKRIADENVGINEKWLGYTTTCKSLPFFLEFFNSGVSKGKAIEFIAEYCGISTTEIVGFGDGMNDMPLIRTAGFGVAMGNAFPEVKAAADYVTSTNNEDGVAKVIEQLEKNM